MSFFKNMMQGRYGYDQLSKTLFYLSILCFVINLSINSTILLVITYILVFISFFRAFSKNTKRRGLENYKYMILVNPIYKKYYSIKQKFTDRKSYRFFKCPKCRQKLRVPKRSGHITVSCPKCQHKFEKKA